MDPEAEYELVRDLMKRKKKLMAKIRKSKKSQIKDRMEKKKINEQLRSIRSKKNLFTGMDPVKAAATVKKTIEDIKPEDIYPRDLEREFDKIDNPSGQDKHKVLDLGKIREQPIAVAPKNTDDDDNISGVIVGEGSDESEEVMDFSEQ